MARHWEKLLLAWPWLRVAAWGVWWPPHAEPGDGCVTLYLGPLVAMVHWDEVRRRATLAEWRDGAASLSLEWGRPAAPRAELSAARRAVSALGVGLAVEEGV